MHEKKDLSVSEKCASMLARVFRLEKWELFRMAKVAVGARIVLCPLPAVLLGDTVDGKPNFSAYAWCGIVNSRPPMLSVAFQHSAIL